MAYEKDGCEIIEQHDQDELKTYIAYQSDLSRVWSENSNLSREFIIYDDAEVIAQLENINNNARGSVQIKYLIEVKRYRDLYELLLKTCIMTFADFEQSKNKNNNY